MQPFPVFNDRSSRQIAVLVIQAVTLLALALLPAMCKADELVLDESFTDMQTVGDFDVSTFISPIDLSEQALITNDGEIDAGQLYSYFKSRGITKVYELNLCLDVDSDIRSDHALNGIEFRIEDLKKGAAQIYSLGDNVLKLPGYETSDMKPEAGITVRLGYDFMQEFNENSTEKLKFTVDGKDVKSLPMQVAFLTPPSNFSLNRLVFLTVFVSFWILVFFVLFRTTLPKNRNLASPA